MEIDKNNIPTLRELQEVTCIEMSRPELCGTGIFLLSLFAKYDKCQEIGIVNS